MAPVIRRVRVWHQGVIGCFSKPCRLSSGLRGRVSACARAEASGYFLFDLKFSYFTFRGVVVGGYRRIFKEVEDVIAAFYQSPFQFVCQLPLFRAENKRTKSLLKNVIFSDCFAVCYHKRI